MDTVQRFGPFGQQRIRHYGSSGVPLLPPGCRRQRHTRRQYPRRPAARYPGLSLLPAGQYSDKLALAASNNVRRIIVIFIRFSFLSKAHGAAFFQSIPGQSPYRPNPFR